MDGNMRALGRTGGHFDALRRNPAQLEADDGHQGRGGLQPTDGLLTKPRFIDSLRSHETRFEHCPIGCFMSRTGHVAAPISRRQNLSPRGSACLGTKAENAGRKYFYM